MKLLRPILFCFSALLSTSALAADRVGPGVPEFWVRPGYKVTVAADDLGNNVRFIEFDDKGRLYLSQPGLSKILQLRDNDGDGVFETKSDFVTDKNAVHGMHFVRGTDGGWLWYGRDGGIEKIQVKDDGSAGATVTVVEGLPDGGGHWWRSICVASDGFYTSIGDSGNTTPDEYDGSDRQKIWKFSLDGKSKKLWSTGIRNTEKLRLRPGTDELWGADHGSDNFGGPYGEKSVRKDGLSNQAITDKMPPEEFNHYIEGAFYGHPFIVGNRVPRLEYRDRPDIAELAARTTPPEYSGGAHWANNGWTFVNGDYFGDMKGDAVIAYHGSWNSSVPVGYQLHRVFFDKETGKPYGGYALVTCIGPGNRVIGRPCDVAEAPDGTLLWSDDRNRKIYRLSKE
jgi:glucose/arabinose dehydrogenase